MWLGDAHDAVLYLVGLSAVHHLLLLIKHSDCLQILFLTPGQKLNPFRICQVLIDDPEIP
ncbi:MAG TPA: hypothetical protein VM577_02965 [Anaerovoracaceae bacterium]|nr:hypothetical protein [Anaerovoracaceae bacterium]